MKNAQKLNNSLTNSNLNQSGSIFIDMDAKRKKVDKLLSDKWNIERKIENIQSECNHENKVLKQIKENGFELRWVCDDCTLPLGWPSKAERDEFLK